MATERKVNKMKLIVNLSLVGILIILLLIVGFGDKTLSRAATRSVAEFELTSDGKGYVLSKIDFEKAENMHIIIPKTHKGKPVVAIGNSAFSGQNTISKIYIPKHVVEIPENLSTQCPKLREIEVSKKNEVFSSVDGILYNKEQTEFVCVPTCLTGEVEIPATIKKITKNLFREGNTITELTLGANIEEIAPGALNQCKSVENYIISADNQHFSSVDGNLMNKSGTELIRFCAGKEDTTVILNKKIVKIHAGAFSGCKLDKIFFENASFWFEWDSETDAPSATECDFRVAEENADILCKNIRIDYVRVEPEN